MDKIIYLNDITYEGKKEFKRTPAGIKYNCCNCNKIMYTEKCGSYKYCLNCFNKWNKNKNTKPIAEFID